MESEHTSDIKSICVTDIAFRYTEHGAEGLLGEKKAINIVAHGGDYCSEPYCYFESDDRYLKTIFGFFSIVYFITVFADKLDVAGEDVDGIVNTTIKEALDKANIFRKKLTKKWRCRFFFMIANNK